MKFLATTRIIGIVVVLLPNVLTARAQTETAEKLLDVPRAVRTIPFELIDNLIYLPTQVNGSKPLAFVWDTGAPAFVIDPLQAKALKLTTEGAAKGTGAGAGTFDYTFAKNVTYTLPGGIEIVAPSSYVVDLSGVAPVFSRPFVGLLGFDFPNRYVVEINYDAETLRLFEPQTFRYAGKGEIIPFTIKGNKPHIMAELKVAGLDPAEIEFIVDTGSADAVSNDLIAKSSAPKVAVAGTGLGESITLLEGPVEWLKIGGLSIEGLYGTGGSRSLIGNEVLRRFTVIFDYSRKQMILEPNQHFRDAMSFDKSGINLRPQPVAAGFVINAVRKDSPAADAGLKEGDVITSIDNHPSASFTAEQIRLLFVANRLYDLGVKRGNESLRASIKLKSSL